MSVQIFFPVALQVDSSSPCDCLFSLERAEATSSLACAGTRDTLARWWSANDMEVSCKAGADFFWCENGAKCGCVASYVNDGLEWLVANRLALHTLALHHVAVL